MERRLSRPLLISAIVPIAGFPNGTQQIESWTSALELRDFEVILVVDSEELKTKAQVKILADRLRKITKVSVLESHCRNPGGSRNLGLSIASGSWITFWDCDDIPNPSRFVEMVIEAETCGKDIAIGEFTIQNGVRHRLKPHKSTDPSNIFESVAVNPGLWRFAIKSDIAKLLRFPDLRMAEDQVYLYELFQESQNISI